MANIVAIDSSYAADIRAAADFREKNVHPYFESKGLTIERCFGPMARRAYAQAAAKRPEVRYLTGAGHGDPSAFLGWNAEAVYAPSLYDPQEVQGHIAHFLSCANALTLGPDFVAHGCAAYIGYDGYFSFDPDAPEPFFACDAAVDIGLADGLTVGEAVTRAIALFHQTIGELHGSGQHHAAAMLETNLSYLRSPLSGPQWGDSLASL